MYLFFALWSFNLHAFMGLRFELFCRDLQLHIQIPTAHTIKLFCFIVTLPMKMNLFVCQTLKFFIFYFLKSVYVQLYMVGFVFDWISCVVDVIVRTQVRSAPLCGTRCSSGRTPSWMLWCWSGRAWAWTRDPRRWSKGSTWLTWQSVFIHADKFILFTVPYCLLVTFISVKMHV